MAPLWTLLALFAAGRVIQSEPLLPELLDRFGPVARGDAFQVTESARAHSYYCVFKLISSYCNSYKTREDKHALRTARCLRPPE